MLIKKVRLQKDDRVHVIWIEAPRETDGKGTEHNIKCEDSPVESFDIAFSELGQHACLLSEDDTKKAKLYTVLGLDVTQKEDTKGITLYVEKRMLKSDSNIYFNTPLKYLDKSTDQGADKGDVFSREAAENIERVLGEVKDYIEGKHLQTNAFDESDNDDSYVPADIDQESKEDDLPFENEDHEVEEV